MKLSYSWPDILVTTPNRLVHMLSLDPPAITLDKLVCFIDECVVCVSPIPV